MLGTNGKQVTVALVAILAIMFGFGFLAPVGPGPGTPLRMYDAAGTDLKVAALTYSKGPDKLWNRLTDPAAGMIPGRVLLAMDTFQMGSGQELAHSAGVDAAVYVLGRSNLDEPVGVYPGVVSGTSSGLAWALATLLLNDPELRDGGAIYATGALYGDEGVGSINGLAEKLLTPGLSDAKVVFVPASQFREAINSLNMRGFYDIAKRVVGVAYVSDALQVLCKNTPDARSC
jgi:hypothetical protein